MADVQQDAEKRVGQLQLELVNASTCRQQVEHQLNCLRLDLEAEREELRSERARHEAETTSLRARLSRADEMLATSREEALVLAESRAGLEREFNLLKLQNPSQIQTQPENKWTIQDKG